MLRRALFVAAGCALALPAAASAGGPTMLVGATADVAKQGDPALAQAEVLRAKSARFDSIRLTQHWLPGQTEPSAPDLAVLRNATFAAMQNQMQVVLVVSNPGSRTTPLTEEARKEFAQFLAALARALPTVRYFTVGNEPNLNGFWMPQFTPTGESASPPAYLALLAEAYDALKAESPQLQVLGGALSPRGADNPLLSRHTHSPTRFILELGKAYRASGRTAPVMDALSINPFANNSSQSPATAHPNSTTIGVADYDKLVRLLGQAFDGTPQAGSTLPIYYGEFGVESLPPAEKLSLYTGTEPTTTRPVDEKTQAEFYRKALELSFCQPNVRGIFMFLTIDDPRRPGWQSGLWYPDKTPKTSLAPVRQAVRQTKGGIVAQCAGMRLTPRVEQFGVFGKSGRYGVHFRCSVDCTADIRFERVVGRRVVLVRRATGRALGGVYSVVRLPRLKLAAGVYRFRVAYYAPLNRGSVVRRTSRPFSVR